MRNLLITLVIMFLGALGRGKMFGHAQIACVEFLLRPYLCKNRVFVGSVGGLPKFVWIFRVFLRGGCGMPKLFTVAHFLFRAWKAVQGAL